MFTLATEEELLDAFRPKDRRQVELPPGLRFPCFVRTSLAWTHPAGGRVFLVFAVPGGAPTGIAFTTAGGDPAVPQLCEWCHSSSRGRVALLVARVSGVRTAGVTVCGDLGCPTRLEEAAEREGRSAVPALEALLGRMGRFASEALKVDLTGGGR